MRRLCALVLFVLCAVLLAGCAPRRLDRFSAEGLDGDTATYESRRADGVATGTTVQSWRREGGLWVYRSAKLDGAGEPKITTLWLDDALAIDHATFGDGRTLARDGDALRGEGPHQPATQPQPAGVVENAISVEALRRAELPKPGERASVLVLNTQRAVTIEARIKNVGAERVSALGGELEAEHLEIAFLTQVHHVWIDAERRVVRYKNPAGGELVLVDWRRDPAAAPPAPPAVAEPARPAPKLGVVIVAAIAQVTMVFGPMILAVLLKWRWRRSYRLWGLGALAFVGSQIVHIPLNWAIGILTGSHGAGLWPLPAFSVIAGLSAGTCESLARWLMLRFAIKERDDRSGAFVGAGHGGVESIILGFLAGLGTLNLSLIGFMGAEKLGVPKDQLPAIDAALASFFSTPPLALLSAATERFGAVAFHVLANVMVMRAVAHRRPVWLLGAIALHAAIDGGLACFALVELGPGPVSVLVPALGVAFVIALWRMLRAQPDEARS